MKNVFFIALVAALFICAVPLVAQSKEALSPEAFLQMGHSDGVIAVAYSPDGRRIATGSGSSDNTVKVWDAETGRELRTLAGHSDTVWAVNYSPDGKRIVSGSHDKTVKIWDMETGREISTLSGHNNGVMSVAYSPDGRRIVSASGDRTLKIWDTETGRVIRTLTGHSLGVETAVYSPDGRRIASGSNDKTIKIWDAETGREIRTLAGHNQAPIAVSFSPDGRRIVSSDNGETDNIKIWDAETGGALRTISTGVFVYSARFSPDGGRIICGSDEKTVKIFDAVTGREIRSLARHGDYVSAVVWSPDGRRILSGSGDNTAKIWDAATGAEIMTLGIPAPLTRDMIAEYLALAGDSAAKTGAFSGPSLYRAGPRETALQFGAMVSKTLVEKRFLDPQNSAALRRGEALLQSVAGKGGVSRAEMQDYLRQGIAAVVDEEFNKISFLLKNSTTNRIDSHNAVLIRTPQNNYILSYEGYHTSGETKTISVSTLDALLTEMRKNKADFDDTGIQSVRAEAARIPTVVFERVGIDSLGVIKDILATLYTAPSQETYNAVKSVYLLYFNKRIVSGDSFFGLTRDAYENVLTSLNPDLARKVVREVNNMTAQNTLPREQSAKLEIDLRQ